MKGIRNGRKIRFFPSFLVVIQEEGRILSVTVMWHLGFVQA
jgi:hypothetical protein